MSAKHTPRRSVSYASGALMVWDNTIKPSRLIARIPNKGYPTRAHVDAQAFAGVPDAVDAMRAAVVLLDSVAFVSQEGDTHEPLKLLRDALAKASGDTP